MPTQDAEDWLRWWRRTGERELRCVLMTAWDPIGVGDAVEAWDEYDSYALGIAHRLRDGAESDGGAGAVAEYLNHVERDLMEIRTSEGSRANHHLADSLVAWHEWSFRQGGVARHESIDG